MIAKHQGLALDLSRLKAICVRDMELVFEFNNILLPINNQQTGKAEMQSFSESPIVVEYETIDSLHSNLNRWVEVWEEWKDGN